MTRRALRERAPLALDRRAGRRPGTPPTPCARARRRAGARPRPRPPPGDATRDQPVDEHERPVGHSARARRPRRHPGPPPSSARPSRAPPARRARAGRRRCRRSPARGSSMPSGTTKRTTRPAGAVVTARTSYDAHAMCDSCSVTAIAVSCAASPSPPSRAAATSRSAITLHSRSVVVLTPRKSGSSSRLRYDSGRQDAAQRLGRAPDVDHHAVGVERRRAEGRVDDERRAVQPLRGTEHLAREAVGDHDVVAHRDGVGHAASLQSIVWHRPGRRSVRDGGHDLGQVPPRRLPVEQGVERGVAQQPSARASRSAVVRLPRRRGATMPTWLERIVRRREWKSPAEVEAHGAVAEPAGLDDLALGRDASRCASCSPSSEPLVSMTRSRSRGASSGMARTARRGARTPPPSRGRRRRAMTSMPGMPRSSRATAQPIIPAPTTRDAIADEGRGIPQDVHRRLDGAREHRPAGGDAVGHDRDGRCGHDEGRLVGEQREDGAADELARAAARRRRR